MSGMREKFEDAAEVSRRAAARVAERIGMALREACSLPEREDRDDRFAALLSALDEAERGAAR
ncbi:hypothetical protein [uncultured Amaricoccus sp.]|uniref:hypothetical protein n=1 Tax=uncultured Amaricoccus sp. TaxID=339341 RepID=UPI002632DA26|nr:hypothetical protein [uncultured Amaricoccus sp.]